MAWGFLNYLGVVILIIDIFILLWGISHITIASDENHGYTWPWRFSDNTVKKLRIKSNGRHQEVRNWTRAKGWILIVVSILVIAPYTVVNFVLADS